MLLLLLLCLLAALIAVALGELFAASGRVSGWLCRIIEYAVLLAAMVWLRAIFHV